MRMRIVILSFMVIPFLWQTAAWSLTPDNSLEESSLTSVETENLNVVKRIHQNFHDGDIQSVLSVVEEDADWQVYGPQAIPWAGPFKGLRGITEFFSILSRNLKLKSMTPSEYIVQNDTVVGLGHYEFHILPTGKVAGSYYAHVFTIKDGKVVNFRGFFDTASMVEALRP